MKEFLIFSFFGSFIIMDVCWAADKTVILPFDLVLQKKEEDFFIGASKPNSDEQKRLEEVRGVLTQILQQERGHILLDIAKFSKEIEASAPLVECNGCELDFAKKLGADILFTGVVDKASDTLLNMRIAEIDVSTGITRRAGNVVIQGNTDEAWIRGVRWLMKNRFTNEDTK